VRKGRESAGWQSRFFRKMKWKGLLLLSKICSETQNMARDKFHEEVRHALENDGWTITADPLSFKVGKVQVQIDLGAERMIAC
jgi:hypothetical protein